MFVERDKHYPSSSGQASLATAITNITKPVTKIYFGPSTILSTSALVGVLLLSTEQGDDNPEAHIENAGKNIC